MFSRLRSLVFAAVMGLICAVLLTAASSGLRPYQEANMELDRQRNILAAVGLIDPETNPAPGTVRGLYHDSIRSMWVDGSGRLHDSAQSPADLPLYLCLDGQTLRAYVIPIDTRGLWGPIKGYLAVEKDGSTIAGFTVFKHAETPGLGGEIEKRWFQKNFAGKRIVNRAGQFVSVAVAKGKVGETVAADLQDHYVDGISGATLTGKYLSGGLQKILSDYEPVAVQFRQNRYPGANR
jgi:Na+-transporting NADH:ubiquinone oxidoreductase subunit C